MKNKEKSRNCHRLEETKETWQLNVVSYPRLYFVTEKRAEEKTSEMQKLSIVDLITIAAMLIS